MSKVNIKDFIFSKLNEEYFDEYEYNEIKEDESASNQHIKLSPEEISKHRKYAKTTIPKLSRQEYERALNNRFGMNTEATKIAKSKNSKKVLTKKELNSIQTDSNMKVTNKLIKYGLKALIPITIGALIIAITIDNTNKSSYKQLSNNKKPVITISQENELKKSIPAARQVNSEVAIENIKKEIKNESELNAKKELNKQTKNKEKQKQDQASTSKSKEKTKAESDPLKDNSFYDEIRNRESKNLLNKKTKVAKPHWDNSQWSVGFGTSVEGFNSKRSESKNDPPYSRKNNKWVTNFRKVYGGIEAHPDDKDPSPEFPEGQISYETANKAFLYFIEKNNQSISKNFKFVKDLPKNIKNVVVDISYNMGSNTLGNFKKFSEHINAISLILKNNKKITDKNIIKKYNEHLLGAIEEIIKSDYFIDSHIKRKQSYLRNKIKDIRRFKKHMKSKNKSTRDRNKDYYNKTIKEIETSRPILNLLMLSKEFISKNVSPEDLLEISKHAYDFYNVKSKRNRKHFKSKYKIEFNINENLLKSYILNILNS